MNQRHRSPGAARRQHKTAQLCRQVFRTLAATIPSLGEDVLLELSVENVIPCPDASRLLITLRASSSAPLCLDDAYAALARRSGQLRREVAAVITRKRAPELAFQIIPATEGTA